LPLALALAGDQRMELGATDVVSSADWQGVVRALAERLLGDEDDPELLALLAFETPSCDSATWTESDAFVNGQGSATPGRGQREGGVGTAPAPHSRLRGGMWLR
jgi:hypothetical protein